VFPSKKSTIVSANSPTTGAANSATTANASGTADAADLGAEPGERAPLATGGLAVGFEVLRSRAVGWTVFGLVAGTLLVVMMGTVAQWIGAILIAVGVYSAWALARTYLFPTQKITVDDDGVSLPRGQCTNSVDRRPLADVTAVYFLRRSVPWTRAAPVLVVEAGGRAYTYPRDWFVNEAEQRQIIHAILGRIRPDAISGLSGGTDRPKPVKAPKPPPPRISL
jgi:hypothetical protein